MSGTLSVPPVAQRTLVAVLLLAASIACWGLLLVQTGHRGFGNGLAAASPTLGLPADAFLAVWVMVIIAMILPTAAPMVLTFHRVETGKEGWSEGLAATWLFVAGYVVVWAAAGVLAYLGMLTAEAIGSREGLSPATAARAAGGLLVVAGLYQLTPLKTLCLAKCRAPLAFVLTEWRDGTTGAMRMGLLHGALCFGSCWLLVAVLLPLGLTNIAAIVLVAAFVFAEKVLPWQRTIVYGIAVLLIAYGALALVTPRALPTFVAPSPSTAPTATSPTPAASVPAPHATLPVAAPPPAAAAPPAAAPPAAAPPAAAPPPPVPAPPMSAPPLTTPSPAASPAAPSSTAPPPVTAPPPMAAPTVGPATPATPPAAGPTLKPGGAMSLEKW